MTATETPPISHTPTPPGTSRRRGVPASRILRRAAVIIPLSAALTAAGAAAAQAVFGLDADFAGTHAGTVAVTVTAALLIGTGVFALSVRTDAASRRFERIATVVVATSLIGPVTTLWSQPPDGPAHHRPQTMVTLIMLHLITYAAALTLRPRDDH